MEWIIIGLGLGQIEKVNRWSPGGVPVDSTYMAIPTNI
jgi:hypothetical protein